MRLVDALLRQGHLSERALVDAIMTGDRPAHLDRCDLCAERAMVTGRGLDAVKLAAQEAADMAFPAERLAAQQAQILRRLEQVDEPTRVIAFPAQTRADRREPSQRRVAPAWVGVAAAAGLVIGAVGGHQVAGRSAVSVAVAPPAAPQPAEPALLPENTSLLEMDLDAFTPEPLGAINELTPRVTTIASR